MNRDNTNFPELLDLLAGLQAHALFAAHEMLTGLERFPSETARDGFRSRFKLFSRYRKRYVFHKSSFNNRFERDGEKRPPLKQALGYGIFTVPSSQIKTLESDNDSMCPICEPPLSVITIRLGARFGPL